MNINSKLSRTILVFLTIALFSVAFANGVIQDVQAHYDAGEYKQALELITPFVEENPDLPQALILAGKVNFKMGNLNKGIELVDKAIKIDRNNQQYREVRNQMSSFTTKVTEAVRARKNGKRMEAAKQFSEILEENPNYAEGHFLYARTLLELDQAEKGAKALKNAIELRPDVKKYQQFYDYAVKKNLNDGNQLLQRRDYARAQQKFEQALILDPQQYLAQYLLARSYFAQRNYPKALAAVEDCINIKDDYIKAYVVKGNTYVKMNQLDKALETFNKITSIDKNYYPAWNKIGFINYRRQNYEAAIPAYEKVTELNPEYQKAYENLGVIYSENKNWENAIKNLKKAGELKPTDETVWYRLSSAYNAIGEAAKAKKAAQKALNIKSMWAAPLFELGVAERRLGNMEESKTAFRMAAKDSKWKKAAEHELKAFK